MCVIDSLHTPNRANPEMSVIELLTDSGQSGGTGFEVLAPSGKQYTVTNAHMCKAGAVNAVIGNRRIPLRIIEQALDGQPDLCLLEGLDRPALRVSQIDIDPGDSVDVYGYGLLLPLTHTHGLFVGDAGEAAVQYFGFHAGYATSSILPGNSGSPVLDAYGRVVGVAFASGEALDYRTLFIRLSDLINFLGPY